MKEAAAPPRHPTAIFSAHPPLRGVAGTAGASSEQATRRRSAAAVQRTVWQPGPAPPWELSALTVIWTRRVQPGKGTAAQRGIAIAVQQGIATAAQRATKAMGQRATGTAAQQGRGDSMPRRGRRSARPQRGTSAMPQREMRNSMMACVRCGFWVGALGALAVRAADGRRMHRSLRAGLRRCCGGSHASGAG
jgi:hypothetical protein